jgi:hypothetical protein
MCLPFWRDFLEDSERQLGLTLSEGVRRGGGKWWFTHSNIFIKLHQLKEITKILFHVPIE